MADVTPFPFATVDDLKARWPGFPVGGEAHAAILLEDASQYMLDVLPSTALASESTRRRIVCAVVRRSMSAGDAGVESSQFTSGPFSMSNKATNPHGDFYLTKQEKKALGFGRQSAFGVKIADTASLNHQPWCSLAFGATYCSCGADLTLSDPLWEY